jgi:hypothetical protein
MMAGRADRTVPGGQIESRARFRTATAYLQTAGRVLQEAATAESASVAAGNAVLAGIAASNSICCSRLGRMHRGDDHRPATKLLEQATVDGKTLATTLSRLLELKDTAHYGAALVTTPRASAAVKWAQKLVDRAREEIER